MRIRIHNIFVWIQTIQPDFARILKRLCVFGPDWFEFQSDGPNLNRNILLPQFPFMMASRMKSKSDNFFMPII